MENNRAIYPCICTLSKNTDKMYIALVQMRVITKLPNSEQSYKGKVKTRKYINRQNQSTTGTLKMNI